MAEPIRPSSGDRETGDDALSPRTSPVPGLEEFEEIFSEEFAAQAEAQLDEAMQMLASENPELWRQFEALSQSAGRSDSSRPRDAETGEGDSASLDAKLEETVQQLRQSTEQIEVGFACRPKCLSQLHICVFGAVGR